MDFKQAFHKAYLQQQDIEEVTQKNIRDHSIDPDRIVLLDETENYWIIKVLEDDVSGEFIDVIAKDSFVMETIAI